jgi:hypothetical protein
MAALWLAKRPLELGNFCFAISNVHLFLQVLSIRQQDGKMES